MALKSTDTAYGAIAVGLHWLGVLLTMVMLITGFRADAAAEPAAKAAILAWHAPAGSALLLVTLIRILWWWLADRKPAPLDDPAWQVKAARGVHLALYAVILGMVGSGFAMFILSGAGEVIFGGSSVPLPDFADYAPRAPHGLGARLLLALVALHAGAALFHHFIRRDATLRRMWFGAR